MQQPLIRLASLPARRRETRDCHLLITRSEGALLHRRATRWARILSYRHATTTCLKESAPRRPVIISHVLNCSSALYRSVPSYLKLNMVLEGFAVHLKGYLWYKRTNRGCWAGKSQKDEHSCVEVDH